MDVPSDEPGGRIQRLGRGIGSVGEDLDRPGAASDEPLDACRQERPGQATSPMVGSLPSAASSRAHQ